MKNIFKKSLLFPLLLLSFSLSANEYVENTLPERIEYAFPKDEQEIWKLTMVMDNCRGHHEYWAEKDSGTLSYEKSIWIYSLPKSYFAEEEDQEHQSITAQSWLEDIFDAEEWEDREVVTQMILDQEHKCIFKQWSSNCNNAYATFELACVMDTKDFIHIITLEEESEERTFAFDQEKWLESVIAVKVIPIS